MAERLDERPGTSQTTPASASEISQTSPASASGNTVRDIQAVKWAEYDITPQDDEGDCYITGLSITPDGRRLLAEYHISKIKMFSRDMKIISSLTLPDRPWDIAVTEDREAAVSVYNKSKLFILDVSDKQMSIRRTVKLSFGVDGIVTHKDKLVVTSPRPYPASVKLIDHRGQVYWSTSTDQQGQQLFFSPWHVASYDDRRSSTVIVTDWGNNTLTVLNSDTGDVISRHQVEGKKPRGVTTDTAGNVYVFYWRGEVAVWTRDLSEEKILLTLPYSVWPRPVIAYINWPGRYWPPPLAYDSVEDKLLVLHEIQDE